MMRKILTSLLSAFCAICVFLSNGQTPASERLTARSVFEQLPDSVLDLIPLDTRLDMLDYFDVDSIYNATNAMQGKSHLVSVTADYLKLQITNTSILEIKVLPYKKSFCAAVVYTVSGPAADSELRFYDSAMSPIAVKNVIKLPKLKDFFHIPKGSITTMKEIENMIPFSTVEYTLSPDNTCLTAKLTIEEYMNPDDYNIAKLFLLPERRFNWKGSKYEQ